MPLGSVWRSFAGDFTVAARLRTSLRRNAVFYAAYGLIMVILLIILIVRGEAWQSTLILSFESRRTGAGSGAGSAGPWR